MSVTRISISSASGVPSFAWNTRSRRLNVARKSSSLRIGLIFIDTLHVDLVIPRMGSNKLDPDNPRAILHLHDQAVFISCNVEHYPVTATDTCAAVLILYVLRGSPVCLDRFVVP